MRAVELHFNVVFLPWAHLRALQGLQCELEIHLRYPGSEGKTT